MTTPAEVEVLAARAVELARPVGEEQENGTLELLLVAVGDQPVAVPVQDVRAVRPPGPVAQVPGGIGVLTGLVGGSGDPLVVAALAGLLDLPLSRPAHEQWVVVLDSATAPLGLLADAALDVMTVAFRELRAPTDPGGLTRGLLPDGTVVLDTAALLHDARLSLPMPDQTEEPTWHER